LHEALRNKAQRDLDQNRTDKGEGQ
jgi:hypothetical protein